MAFKIRSLALYASVPVDENKAVNFYVYGSNDAAATVATAGYFNEARSKLKVNDCIEAVCAAGGTGDRLKLLVTAVPADPGDITVAVNTEAAGT